jgi:hypothetical protein
MAWWIPVAIFAFAATYISSDTEIEQEASPQNPPHEPDYMQGVQEADVFLQASKLDRKPGFSREEKLAAGFVLDQYLDITQELFDTNQNLRNSVTSNLQQYYEILKKVRPEPQVVYLDFSNIESYYEKELRPLTGKDLPTFKRKLVKLIERYYLPPSGQRLNLTFTPVKPSEGKFTTVVLSPKSLEDFMYSDDSLKAKMPLMALYSGNKRTERIVRKAIDLVASRLPAGFDERRTMIQVAESPYFKERIASKFNTDKLISDRFLILGAYISVEPTLDFGNFLKDDIVWINMKGFSQLRNIYNSLREKGEEKEKLKYDSNHLTEAIAESIAHELAHSFGLRHPNTEVEKSTRSPRRDYPNNHLMFSLREVGGNHFNDYAFDYFRFIFGVR